MNVDADKDIVVATIAKVRDTDPDGMPIVENEMDMEEDESDEIDELSGGFGFGDEDDEEDIPVEEWLSDKLSDDSPDESETDDEE